MASERSVEDELVEWDYGDYEGVTSAQIDAERPGWDLWRDGCPGGETASAVGARADAALALLPPAGYVLVFSHGHFLRVLIARWVGLRAGRRGVLRARPRGDRGARARARPPRRAPSRLERSV